MTPQQAAATGAILAHHAKTFALAGRLLPSWCRRDAAALYAWCRRCDDAVDTPERAEEREAAVKQLRRELDAIYTGQPQSDPVLGGMQDVVRRHEIPRRYAEDLLAGMAMDVDAGAVEVEAASGARAKGTDKVGHAEVLSEMLSYDTTDQLLRYCYCAAGTVGLMMAHIMGVRDPAALRRAVDLGIAMQLTNICRDVAEDEGRGRVYLPRELLGTSSLPTTVPRPSARVVAKLLRLADDFYRSGDEGLGELPVRCAVAIRAARLIYAEIGTVIARRGFDVRAGRAIVPTSRKVWLLGRATVGTLARRAFRATGPWRMRLGLHKGQYQHQHQPPAPSMTPLPDLPFALPLARPQREASS